MDLSDDSNGVKKSWDHPWTTDEMRQKRNEWSLAADAGLLQHLEQFSNNLTENVEKTKEKLNSLTSDLNETSVIIDNITNSSLALANTQFIESRVREDDIETKQPQGEKAEKIKDERLDKEDLIGFVSESIKQGLRIMEEKFQRVNVTTSDSEDEGGIPITSIVLEAKDPYQNRPLPYVIGSEKWQNSTKVGLESSSSDSEPPDGDEESAGENDNEILPSDMMINNRRESLMRRSSLTSSESSDRNERINTVKHYSGISSRTDKLAARSQDTLNSGSDMATPTVAEPRAETSGKGAPSFAEELAKRLGNVLPSENALPDGQETDRASIHRSKDDLFASDNDDVFGTKSENPFSGSKDLFDAEVSSSLWKNKPYRAPEINVISPCLDIPPPIQTEAPKPRSAFDDLYGDADSDDSDDIFAGKSSTKNTVHQPNSVSDNQRENVDFRENKFLGNVNGDNATNMATSTPETNDNGGIFGDESEGDDDDLFGKSIKSRKKMTERSPETIRTAGIVEHAGLSITQADILSSNLGNRLFSRVPRQNSADSSDSEPSISSAEARLNEPVIPVERHQNSAVSSQNTSEPSSIIAWNAMLHGSQINVEDSDSSGISVPPNSTGNIFGLSVDFQPHAESTRLKSEELYRERVSSDSLFTAKTRPVDDSNSINNSSNQQPRENRVFGTLDSHPEEDFDCDDVFGPPPLPKANSKSKSEFASVDDLFSNISSGSRSPKSSDLLTAAEPQFVGKSAVGGSKIWFDEDIDIFDSGDVPDLDIFNAGSKSTVTSKDVNASKLEAEQTSEQSTTRKSPDLFFTAPTDTAENISSRSTSKKSTRKPHNSIFDDSEEDDDDVDDLFGSSNFLKTDRKRLGMLKSDDDNLFGNTPKSSSESVLTAPKKDLPGEVANAGGANESVTKPNVKPDSDVAKTIENTMPSYSTGGLFDNLDDDDDDSLFDNKKIEAPKEEFISRKVEKKCIEKNEDSSESKMQTAIFESNDEKIVGPLKDSSDNETRDEKLDQKADKPVGSVNDKSPTKKSPKPLLKKKPTEISPKQLLEKVKDREIEKRRRVENERTNEKVKEEGISITDGAKISIPQSSTEIISETGKREPPKTLSIRLPMPSTAEESTQAPRRAVSGKIKNLMGKMGDLKILSPTDTPPLWKKAEEKSDVDEAPTGSRDSEDGSFISVPSAKTPPVTSDKIEEPGIASEESKEPPQPPSSPPDDSGNSESAVSFDVPAQVETLTVTASKSRARIQAKRRPQSRHARQSALRKSGIDFDTVDTLSAEAGESDPSDTTMSSVADNVPAVETNSVDNSQTSSGLDRLVAPDVDNERSSTDKPVETSSLLAPDDRSDMSLSKGSSMSINKNTLLSPSTDEEDLFDVPPDLPEDPPKEDTIFGRAPILSPIDGFLGAKHTRTSPKKSKENRSELRGLESTDREAKLAKNEKISKQITKDSKTREVLDEIDEKENNSNTEKPMDPLRDSSLDPLKDPSQLFAFVTKTPSPEKGQNLLFKEDDSLFTRVTKNTAEESKTVMSKKPVLDLFYDDAGGDLFCAPLGKPAKKTVKNATNSSGLFDYADTEEDATSDLFEIGFGAKADKKIIEPVDGKSSETTDVASPNRASSVFADAVDDDLFVDAFDKKFSPEPEKISSKIAEERLFSGGSKTAKESKLKDLFGDQSSGEEDIFGKKKIIGSGKTSGAASVFVDDDDSADIFEKKTTDKSILKTEPIGNRTSVKKSVTRDLKKTAEKIVEDPLSMLQND